MLPWVVLRPISHPIPDALPHREARRTLPDRRSRARETELMSDNVISYLEMCSREGASLQAGMNFGLGGNHSVVLMSLRPNAPYRDRIEDDGQTLIYEGHDHPNVAGGPDPKTVDQPDRYPSGSLTQNGKFFQAARDFLNGRRPPERVRAYEKLRAGIWAYNGVFLLMDAWKEKDELRFVWKFKLAAVAGEEDFDVPVQVHPPRRRIIPTSVKLEVYKRDHGRCVICGATDDLHFDHDLPWSKGGASMTAANVQIMCARHNLSKSDQIL